MDVLMLRDILDGVLESAAAEPVRAEVRNREPRVQMGGHKWHLIHERDGGRCWMCGDLVPKGTGEVDHLIPRSSFAADDLHIADRSDNLRTACVGCNQRKSNFLIWWAPVDGVTIGVTAKCWDCANDCGIDPEIDPEGYSEYWADRWTPQMTVPAYCARCGHTWVPDAGWLL